MENPKQKQDFHERVFPRGLRAAAPSDQKRSQGGGGGPPPPAKGSIDLTPIGIALAIPLSVAAYFFGMANINHLVDHPSDDGNANKLNRMEEQISELRASAEQIKARQPAVVPIDGPISGFVQHVNSDERKLEIVASGSRVVVASYDPRVFRDLQRGDFVEVRLRNPNDEFPELTKRVRSDVSRKHSATTVNHTTNQARVP